MARRDARTGYRTEAERDDEGRDFRHCVEREGEWPGGVAESEERPDREDQQLSVKVKKAVRDSRPVRRSGASSEVLGGCAVDQVQVSAGAQHVHRVALINTGRDQKAQSWPPQTFDAVACRMTKPIAQILDDFDRG